MKKWVAYAGYIVIVTIFFLYYLFPTAALTSYVNEKLSDSLQGFRLSITRIRPNFPFGLSLESPLLFQKDKEIIGAERLNIRPRFLTLLSPTKAFIFNGTSYGGKFKGSTDLTMNESPPVLNINLQLNNIEIGKISTLRQFIPYSINGVATGNIIFSTKQPYGNGKADITVSSCQIDFKPALFGVDQLKMDTVATSIEMADRQVKINQFDIKGGDLSGKVAGTVILKNPIAASTISITGQISPTSALLKNLGNILPGTSIGEKNIANKGIPFRISGTFENPGFSLK
jgi:type II secretion system protein N